MDATTVKIYKISIAVILILSLVSSVFAVLSYNNEFEFAANHFKFDAPLASAFKVITALSVAVAVVCAVFFNAKVAIKAPPPMNTSVMFTSILAGAFMIMFSLMDFFANHGTATTGSVAFTIAKNILGIPAGICFIACALTPQKKVYTKPVFMFLTFAPVIWMIVSLMAFYFSDVYALNSPVKISIQLMYVALMLFFPNDCRFILGRFNARTYIFTGSCAVLFTGIVAFPNVFTYLSAPGIFNFSFVEGFLYLTLWAYVITRLMSLKTVLVSRDVYAERAAKAAAEAAEPKKKTKFKW